LTNKTAQLKSNVFQANNDTSASNHTSLLFVLLNMVEKPNATNILAKMCHCNHLTNLCAYYEFRTKM